MPLSLSVGVSNPYHGFVPKPELVSTFLLTLAKINERIYFDKQFIG